jgi:hypothetical protein
MKRAYIAAPLALLFVSTNAVAGANSRYSHCYKIKDSQAAAKYTVDLQPNDFRFPDAEGCEIKVPAKLLCVDSYDTNLAPTPAEGIGGGLNGQKYLCYKAKCPVPAAPLVVGVGDALGVREVTASKTAQVCVPIAPDTCVAADDCRDRQNVATAGCGIDGFCSADVCTAGFEDCDNYYGDGCETGLSDDAYNCGTCGTVCSFPNAYPNCTAGACGIDSCYADYADCDGNTGTGCEVYLPSDPNDCGTCSTVCTFQNATPLCSGGNCFMGDCAFGYADCNGHPADGCEVNFLGDDENNCGSCATFCGDTCNGGLCTP